MISKETSARFLRLLQGARRVVLSCHARPDGDAIGSLCALFLALRHRGMDVVPVVPTPLAQNLRSLPGSERIIVFDQTPEAARATLSGCDLVVLLDLNDLKRLDDGLRAAVEACRAPRVIVDHHLNPQLEQFELVIADPHSSSTCELLFVLLQESLGDSCISQEVAQCLYSGIMTDTGSFSYSCRESTFRVAAALMAHGVEQERFRVDFQGSFSESRMRLYGFSIGSRMELFAQGRAAIIALSQQDLDQYSYEPGDTEGLANEPLSIRGVDLSIMLQEHGPGRIRVSLRSRNGVRVNTLAEAHFNGGGHSYAAGGSLRLPFEEAVVLCKRLVTEHLTTPAGRRVELVKTEGEQRP